jgi:hypothetical protein
MVGLVTTELLLEKIFGDMKFLMHHRDFTQCLLKLVHGGIEEIIGRLLKKIQVTHLVKDGSTQ